MDSVATARATPIPRLRGGLPVLGHIRDFQRDPVALLMRGWQDHGSVFQFELAGRDFVVFAGPDAHDAYFRAPEEQLSAKEVYQFTIPIFGQGVAYDASRDTMAEQLGFLYPALRDASMQVHARHMYEEAAQFVDRWADTGEIDLPVVTNELTVNIACRCLLGREIRERLDGEFARLYHDLQGGINTLGFLAPRLPTPRHRRRDHARREVAQLISTVVRERRRAGCEVDDFMGSLMRARYRDGRCLSDDEITGVLLTVLFAGQHTSGVLAAWGLLELVRHPRYLAPILDEIEALYGNGEPMTLTTLKQQPALECAVREAERLHPPLIILMRKVLQDFRYGEHMIPAGTMAMVSPALAHRLPAVFDEPQRYDPDRFAPPRDEHKRHVHALIGFGGGKHRCMGMHFAYMQVKAIWTVLLSRFEFELSSPFPSPDYGSWVTGPRAPCRIRYRRRAQDVETP